MKSLVCCADAVVYRLFRLVDNNATTTQANSSRTMDGCQSYLRGLTGTKLAPRLSLFWSLDAVGRLGSLPSHHQHDREPMRFFSDIHGDAIAQLYGCVTGRRARQTMSKPCE